MSIFWLLYPPTDCSCGTEGWEWHAIRVRQTEGAPGEECGIITQKAYQRQWDSQNRYSQSHAGKY